MDNLNPNIQSPDFKFQQVIGQCRDLTLIELSALISKMYDHAEPALLEFADKAESNAIRSLFIEASLNVRDKRSLVEQTFQKEISKGYANFLHKRPSTINEDEPVQLRHTQWSLVDKTDLEDGIALQKITYKTNNIYYKEIYAYTQRMTLIQGGQKLADRDLPASPLHIMNAFKSAISKIEIDSRTKIIMYVLFEKYVMKKIGSIYDECNALLIEAGIFPNLKPVINKAAIEQEKRPSISKPGISTPENSSLTARDNENTAPSSVATHNKKETGSTTDTKAATETETLSSELLNAISSLLISHRQNNPEYAPSTPTPGAAPIEMASKATLLQQISNIQPTTSKTTAVATNASTLSTDGSPHASIPKLEVDQVFIEGLRNSLTEERNKLFNGIDRRRIPTADMNTIELVGMLFEQMLDDPVLPNAAKTLLCHLHTPYLKAAILDVNTLTSEDHPTQQLMNLMIRVGSQWIDEMNLDFGIYTHLREIIDSILANFDENLQIFEDLHKELQAHAAKLEQKSSAIERRSQEAAQGRDKFEKARAQAMQTIKDCTETDRQLPDIALQFFKHSWTDKLILIILRDPNFKDSEIWRESLQIIDEILELLYAEPDDKKSIPFRKRLDALRKNIEHSLSALGNYQQVDIDTLIKLINGTLTAEEKKHAAETISATPESTKESLGIDSQILTFSDEELEMLQTLENTKCGTWFEYIINGRKGKRRIKLSWYSPATKKYMFVDHNGIQAAVMSAHILVKDLCEGNARILGRTNIPFVSQAFRAIKDKLQKSLNTQPAPT